MISILSDTINYHKTLVAKGYFLENIAGSPVEGENFFGRESDIANLTEILANDDILLLGPRRIGKTSIARAVMKVVSLKGWRTIEINVASCSNERGFLEKLDAALTPELASFTSKTTSAIASAISMATARIKSIKVPIPGAGTFGVELGASAPTEEWTQVGSEVLRLISQVDQRWLIYVDELPIMLFNIIRSDPQTGVMRVRRFLDWFRNDVRAQPGAHAVRWFISGSIGLDTLVQQHGMADTINSLNHQSLIPFKDDVALIMLAKLAARYQIELTTSDMQKIVDGIQWTQPYYLQKAFNHLRSLVSAHPNVNPSNLIEPAIDRMVQPGSDNDFRHWETRLEQQLSPSDASHALVLLKLAAQNPAGERPEILLASLAARMIDFEQDEVKRIFINLRDILERDAYWWPDHSSNNKRYRFRLEPLRRWWVKRGEL